MARDANVRKDDPDFAALWIVRQKYWRRKLGRLRLGVEPLDEQIDKHLRVVKMLTWVVLGIASMFVALFSAFHRPDVGIGFVLLLFLPIISLAWLDYGLLKLRASGYARELREYQSRGSMGHF